MCGSDSKAGYHLFLHCSAAIFLWNRLFGIFEESWIFLTDLHHFLLTKFRSFDSYKEPKILRQCSVFVVLWCIWVERKNRIFNDSLSTLDLFGIGLLFRDPFSAPPLGFLVVLLLDMQRDMLCCKALSLRF